MKKHLLIFLPFLLSLNLYAQTYTDSICTDFDDSALFLTNLSNSWQIGPPSKVVLNNSYSLVKSIITDTINTYPSNETSVFYAVYAPDYIANYLYWYFPFQIEFYHRFDSDSLTDFGSIELSKDGGSTWINGLSTEYGDVNVPMYNSHIFLGAGDTIYDSLAVTGSSNGWVHSTITKDLNPWISETGWIDPDSIIVKFTFTSDAIDNFKDGWQIDNICIKYLIASSIEENESKNTLNIYPNPFSIKTTLQSDKHLKNATLTLYNSLGQQVRQVNNISGQTATLQRDNLPSGLYYLQLTEDNQTIATDKIVISE